MEKVTFMKASYLQSGDIVEIIAPASKFDPAVLDKIKHFLSGWGLKARFADELMGEDFLFANTDAKRFAGLKKALEAPDSKAIWAIRGGYGCARLLAELDKLKRPAHFKWLMGFSDITALHIYVNQKWQWPSLHCASANQIATQLISEDSIRSTQNFILGHYHPYTLELEPLNELASSADEVYATVTGGNLSIVMTSLATDWQIDSKDKFLFIEDVNEEPYRIDRMLNHLFQAGLLSPIKALLIGDFTQSDKKRDGSEMQAVLQYWIEQLKVPALKVKIGHAVENYPIPFASKACLKLGKQASLSFIV
ncbi:MAG: mccF [Gammaproteobacteria bacterium]|jgi:muramoyltetrapeptide carboxypeptidase|nr:mccF [Gammaproteobacteria bacterium]